MEVTVALEKENSSLLRKIGENFFNKKNKIEQNIIYIVMFTWCICDTHVNIIYIQQLKEWFFFFLMVV